MNETSGRIMHGDRRLQAVLLSRSRYTPGRAVALLRRHGHTLDAAALHATPAYLRYRENPPGSFSPHSLVTVKTRFSGVKAIVGEPRRQGRRDAVTGGPLRRLSRTLGGFLP